MKLPNMLEAKKRDKSALIENYQYEKIEIDSSLVGKKYYVRTYGCQMNEHDSENIRAILEEMGYTESIDYTKADIVILNTCAIRENAHNKVFGFLGRLKHQKRDNPNLLIGLCGCMAQEEVVVKEIMEKYKWLNFVFGTHNIHELPNVLKMSVEKQMQEIEVWSKEGDIIEDIPVKRDSTIKAWVNIMYGCDKFCTYCIVPYTRGRQRSRLPKDIIDEVNTLVKNNYMEVTLLGQNVNAYGKDFDDFNYNMANLLEDVAKTNIPRIRFVTSHPWDFTDEMIDVIASYPNIMPYIHLPIQSGSNKILKNMGRRYTKETYLELFNKIKTRIPNAAITTDIIVGFPNETEEDFNETLNIVNTCKFDLAYTFIYSKREGTPASRIEDHIPLEEKEERLQRLNEIVNNYAKENNEKLVGKIVPVLIEGLSEKDNNKICGYTDTMKLVNVSGSDKYIGKIVNVKITSAKSFSLDGEIING